MLARLLAELVNGRSRDRAVYGWQRQHGVELADGGAEFQAGWNAASGIVSVELWSVRSTLGSVAVQSNDVTPSCSEQ